MKLYLTSTIAVLLFMHCAAYEEIPSVNYNARKGPDSEPDSVKCKTWEDVYNDLMTLQGGYTDKIRINSLLDCNQAEPLLQYAKGISVKLDLGISTSNGHDYFVQEKAKLGEYIDKKFIDDRVASLHVGSDAISRGTINVDTAIAYMNEIRDYVRGRGINASITIAEGVDVYNANPQLIDAVDYISVNYFSFWERADANEGVAITLDRLKSLRIAAANKGKKLVLSETGWSSGGSNPSTGVASSANQLKFYSDLMQMARSHNLSYYWSDAFDATWRGDNAVEAHFGMYETAGMMKENLLKLTIDWKEPRAIRNDGTKLMLSENDGKLYMSSKSNDWLVQEQQVWFFDSVTQQVRSKSSDRCLDAYQPQNGGDVHVYRCMDNEANQKWTFDNATHTLQHATHKGFCLDQDPAQNNKVQLYGCSSNNPNQQWSVIDPATI